jgi:dimethylamine/trimethylamine dehydrogenase
MTGCFLKMTETSNASPEYLDTLLRYYEDEIRGEAYFFALAEYFEESDKIILLGKVERCAAQAVVPLLQKYGLEPREDTIIHAEGNSHLWGHEDYTWTEFLTYIINRYPAYLDDFNGLESMAPNEDLYALKKLTEHEVAAIDFAKKELAGDPDSLSPLRQYMD